MTRAVFLLFISFLYVEVASYTSAQDILEQHYGSGVHAYFASDFPLAEEYFNDVIEAGSQDPRVFYFRGLTQIQTQCCMMEAGLGDFEQAAQLEISGKRSGDVAKALSRIQGPTRIVIERIRAKARLAAKNLQADMMQSHAAGIQPNNGAAPTSPIPTDPFAAQPNLTEGEARPMPTPGDAPLAPLPPAPDPFATTPDATMPAPTTPAPDTSNPFGDDPATKPATPVPDANPFN